ncbi:hypothetical protein Amet_3243 [Alkaliphilus metalliredigens QYMF]|uniref:Uncharacterized protein n=1 Tax=Alkaliphilus metalliredigens (strain QYMF) TaxID=293826 RepID=A6TT63_ALKMQ|nr:hypothetical protein [Alkaliphilus metalliredigens]ABR49381.1 hypothetical protein Amet_3243 [Alkaliphilus metalliredigens QYMF]
MMHSIGKFNGISNAVERMGLGPGIFESLKESVDATNDEMLRIET